MVGLWAAGRLEAGRRGTYADGVGVRLDAQGTEEGAVPVGDSGGQSPGRGVNALEVGKSLCGITADQGGQGSDGRGEDEDGGEVDHFGSFLRGN